jgi:hypothetical protein
MEVILEILKYTVPSAIIFVGVYFILKSFFENEQRKRELSFKNDNYKLITPIKLQAYERMVLFLERANLSNLVMRTYAGGMSSSLLHSSMLASIRHEYEHNIALQLYIPTVTWKMIKSSKEETIKVINNCADQLNSDASGLELSQFILELAGKVKTTPTEIALEALKSELNKTF